MNADSDQRWSFPAWDEVEMEQLRLGRALPLRRKLEWLEQAAETADRLQKSRENQRLVARERRKPYPDDAPTE